MAPTARQLMQAWLAAAMAVLAAPLWAQSPQGAPGGSTRPVVRFAQLASAVAAEPQEQLAAPAADEEPEILRSLPPIPDMPASLYQPASSQVTPAPDFERPYFQRDPLLDPLDWAQPGWFADAEVGLIKPHVSFSAANQVTTVFGPKTVQIGSAHLNMTAAPRFEIGYRLPSGFGEFSVSDRFFTGRGSDSFVGPAGLGSRSSSLSLNYTDIDYASRELTPWNNWSLKFRGGLRFAQTSFSTSLNEPFAGAAASGAAFFQTQSNRASGGGAHFGFQLDRSFPARGLTLVSQADIADLMMRTHQQAAAAFTALSPTGGFDTGTYNTTFLQQNPILTVQIGLNFQPARWRNSRLYFGYFGQFWYLFATDTTGQPPAPTPVQPSHFDQEGMVFQWSWNH